MISVEIISVSFDASFEDLICSWEKKTFTTEMIISGNGPKSFLSRKCPATSENGSRSMLKMIILQIYDTCETS